MNMIKKELITKLNEIKNMGFIPSGRKGSTGIGYTLEKLLGVAENNIPIADIGGRLEIKATRRGSNSLITLFTFNRGVWLMKQQDVVNQYGYVDNRGRKALKRTFTLNTISTTLKMQIDLTKQTISIVDTNTNEPIAIWSLYVIVGRFMSKLSSVLYVVADHKFENGEELFHYNEAYILSDPNPEKFLEGFKNSQIAIDVRMHLKPNGTVRNRGTAFRVYEQFLPELYNKRERIL